MDWKAYYRSELEGHAGRAAVREGVRLWKGGDPLVMRVLRARGIVSFPHTTILDSAEPLARVASSILAGGFERVVAFGVLHGSALPAPHRERMAWIRARAPEGRAHFASLGGGFLDRSRVATPYGTIAPGPSPGRWRWLRGSRTILQNEFSLDLFLAVLAAVAAQRGVPPPPVTRVYVGPTETYAGTTEPATGIFFGLRPLLGSRVARVATGDLVHFGHGYSTEKEIAALPSDHTSLERYFFERLTDLFDACGEGDDLTAMGIAQALRNDQRWMLPLFTHLLGSRNRARFLSYRLSDYGPILGRPSPCAVATALVAWEQAARTVPGT